MAETSSNIGDVAVLLSRMRRAVIDFENEHGKPRIEPLELTKAEYETLKAGSSIFYVNHKGEPLNTFYGVRIVIKD